MCLWTWFKKKFLFVCPECYGDVSTVELEYLGKCSDCAKRESEFIAEMDNEIEEENKCHM